MSNVADICKVGDSLKVKVIAVDDHDRVKLSHRAAVEEPAAEESAEPESTEA